MNNTPSKTPTRTPPNVGGLFNIPINRGACWSYFLTAYYFAIIASAIIPFGVVIFICLINGKSIAGVLYFSIGLLILFFFFLFWLTARKAAALNYRVEGRTLRADWGVFFLKRKAIPLDRITDFSLVQGPLMRMFGVWAMRVQTAGTGSQEPEATLHAIIDPEQVRDELIRRRDEAAVDSNYPG